MRRQKHAGFGFIFLAFALTFVAFGCGSSGSSTNSEASTQAQSRTETFNRSNWDLLASDPDAHKGAAVDFVGKVLVTPERDEKGVYIQVWADPQNSEQNTIVAYGDPSFKVKQDDFVHVTGAVKGVFKGKNAFGAEVTAPTVIAKTLKVVDAVAAAPPAIATLPRQSDRQALVTVVVQKVEFAESETRVFLAVRNRSSYDVSVYSSSMKAVQNGRQVEQTFSVDYPDVPSDIVAGASGSGVVVFPKLNPHGGLTLIVEGNSDNTNVGQFGSLKWTFTWK
jgi:hypothetical protein